MNWLGMDRGVTVFLFTKGIGIIPLIQKRVLAPGFAIIGLARLRFNLVKRLLTSIWLRICFLILICTFTT